MVGTRDEFCFGVQATQSGILRKSGKISLCNLPIPVKESVNSITGGGGFILAQFQFLNANISKI